jgi:glucosyl-3-phosphoglycerate phosphatase
VDRLILVRHGETEWNARGVLQGQADVPLSPAGRAEASALATVVAQYAPEVVVSSDLLRARETAEALGFPWPRLDARWREADLGEWTGAQSQLVLSEHGERYRAWRDGRSAPPAGESFEALRARIDQALAALTSEPGTVLVVTHGGAIRAALASLIGLTPERISPVAPASATVLAFERGARLLAYNITAQTSLAETTD